MSAHAPKGEENQRPSADRRVQSAPSPGERAVSIVGDVVESTIITGDDNVIYSTADHVVGADALDLTLRVDPLSAGTYRITAGVEGERPLPSRELAEPFSPLELHGAPAALAAGRLAPDSQA